MASARAERENSNGYRLRPWTRGRLDRAGRAQAPPGYLQPRVLAPAPPAAEQALVAVIWPAYV